MSDRENIEEFDKLSISDLLNTDQKLLLIAVFIKIKQTNGKVKFHDKMIWAGFISVIFTIFVSVVVGVIHLCFG